jgi:(p)ppGpp synthase/HD superfamily hydrolase
MSAPKTAALPDLLTHAMILAQSAHAGQRYGDLPYAAHLHQVLYLAMAHQVEDVEILCACVLHDILEDTPVPYSRMRDEYGERVAELVYAVTDERGRDRDERHRKTLPKIRAAGEDAILVKLLDRLANVLASCQVPDGWPPSAGQRHHLETYVREYPEFRAALMTAQNRDWRELDMAMERAANLIGLSFSPGFKTTFAYPRAM